MRQRKTGWERARVARLGFLAGRGLSLDAIAADLGVSPQSLRYVMTRWDIETAQPPTMPGRIIDNLPTHERLAIESAAAMRDQTGNALALRLLSVIVSDHLIDSILDDEPIIGRAAQWPSRRS
jgi:hypothetical protein